MPESEAEFERCVKPGLFFENVIFAILDRPGPKYFICNVGNHCNLGMKFGIQVLPIPGSIPPNAALKIASFPALLLLFITIITNFFFFL